MGWALTFFANELAFLNDLLKTCLMEKLFRNKAIAKWEATFPEPIKLMFLISFNKVELIG